ncbi:glycine betaine ABC transporter substrate-binding protein [Alienimonas californiensis]|uniref:Carnitine transport permease protein OpuCB n=1 Tax=Alienimonas californiensis TaxID=2527989 RepID=A0A517P9E9_9PLAN|nr:glycine betaine ABC transporter substrate-binding protein [Alienimonas californiensis]QDT15994.1 Carnitine transport permease protein OpuCB [Alienimonas californiensis]
MGSKAFTESIVLGEMAAQLARDAGAVVTHDAALGGTSNAWKALLSEEIDLYPEYTGTLAQDILKRPDLKTLPELRAAVAPLGLKISEPLGFANGYALGMREDRAEELKIRTLSDLRKHPGLRLGFNFEFFQRDDGWDGLKRAYRLPQTSVTKLEHEAAYSGLKSGALDVIELYTTDAKLSRASIRQLEDDRGFFPDYSAVLIYRADLADRAPAALDAIRQLEGTLDEETMIALNARVDAEGLSEAVAAGELLAERYPSIRIPAAPSRFERIAARTWEHLGLVVTALGFGLLVAIPLGILAAKRPKAGSWVLGGAGLLQTVPSLALFVFLIPVLGLGFAPAAVALFLYSLLPVVRGTHAGLTGIPESIRESARALGLPPAVRLWRVELPLALGSIFAGIKTAAVICVGTATLGGFIAAGGYGEPIFTGLRRDDIGPVLEGAIPAAVMALLVQFGFDRLERQLSRRR